MGRARNNVQSIGGGMVARFRAPARASRGRGWRDQETVSAPSEVGEGIIELLNDPQFSFARTFLKECYEYTRVGKNRESLTIEFVDQARQTALELEENRRAVLAAV
jgi:hypothetical protein